MNSKAELSSLVKFKPLAEIENIIQRVAPFAEPFIAAKGEILRYNIASKHQCYLLHNGRVNLHRRGDGMVLNTESAPFVLGLSNQYSTSGNMYIKVVENAQISRLTMERFNLLAESYGLWQDLCRLLIYNASRIYEHSTIISRMSSYDLIRFQLQELKNEPDGVRLKTTAANYIMDRTYLSRSGVMKILSVLRNGGHICLHRGVLVELNDLPESLSCSPQTG